MRFGSRLQRPIGDISRNRVTSNHDTSSMILLLAQWGSIESVLSQCKVMLQGMQQRDAQSRLEPLTKFSGFLHWEFTNCCCLVPSGVIQNIQRGFRCHPAFKMSFAFPVKVRQNVASWKKISQGPGLRAVDRSNKFCSSSKQTSS